MPETRKILFLGASFAGLGASHYFLKHLYSKLPVDKKVKYEVVVLDPSANFYLRPASPRTAVNPTVLPVDKVFADTASGFKQYGDKARFIQGKAVAWDEQARTVLIEHPDGRKEALNYWALVLATGTKASATLFSLQGSSHEEVQEALRAMDEKIATARNIVIAGGGPSAVEIAGEIGERLNGAAGWFRSRPSNPAAKVTVVTSSSKLLPILRQASADQAEKYLNRVGVDVRYNTKVASTSPSSSSSSAGKSSSTEKMQVKLSSGEELDNVDLYIPAMGTTPMTEYAPPHLKDSRGYIVQNATTLRVDAAGSRVYAVGDVGDASNNGIPAIEYQVPVVATNLSRDLLAAHRDSTVQKATTGKDREFVALDKAIQLVPIGRSKGVGEVFGWRVPSWFVWFMKGRTFMMVTPGDVVEGKNYAKEK